MLCSLGVNYEYLHTELPETHFMTFRVCDIGPWVKNFIHAVALDEMSTWFCATLGMRPPEKLHGDTKFRQVLFAGMHGDVGGRNSRSRKALAFMTVSLSFRTICGEGLRFFLPGRVNRAWNSNRLGKGEEANARPYSSNWGTICVSSYSSNVSLYQSSSPIDVLSY